MFQGEAALAGARGGKGESPPSPVSSKGKAGQGRPPVHREDVVTIKAPPRPAGSVQILGKLKAHCARPR